MTTGRAERRRNTINHESLGAPVIAAADPVRLGSMLLTLVEPHVGHEVAYNRWYERDHFYSGCMIGPWQFAGKRFVATADLKAMRDPDPSSITGAPARGSYVSLYWVLDGHHDDWNLWAVDQVRALHKAGRMFEERDHVHTLLYRHRFDVGREADPVPAELALDHPYKGLIAIWVDAPATEPVETARADLEARLRDEHLPAVSRAAPLGSWSDGSRCRSKSMYRALRGPIRSTDGSSSSGSWMPSRRIASPTRSARRERASRRRGTGRSWRRCPSFRRFPERTSTPISSGRDDQLER